MSEIGQSVNLLNTAGRETVFLNIAACRQRLLGALYKQIWLSIQQPHSAFEHYSKEKGAPWSSLLLLYCYVHNIMNKYYKDHIMICSYRWS